MLRDTRRGNVIQYGNFLRSLGRALQPILVIADFDSRLRALRHTTRSRVSFAAKDIYFDNPKALGASVNLE